MHGTEIGDGLLKAALWALYADGQPHNPLIAAVADGAYWAIFSFGERTVHLPLTDENGNPRPPRRS